MSGWSFAPAPFLIAGPCVVEEGDLLPRVADRLAEIGARLGIRVCLKASFDKANRSSIHSARGPGLEKGLEWIGKVKGELGVPATTDIHEVSQAEPAAWVVDLLQIPAFLCRQTDLLLAAGQAAATHKRGVNVKKGQFMAPVEMKGAVTKLF